jgi:predicted transcriptional regulator
MRTKHSYLKPSKEARILSILQSVAQEPQTSQQLLGRRSGLSSAMVNHYLNVLQQEGLIEFQPINGKSFKYLLTEKGERRRRQMFNEYSSEIVRTYTALKHTILNRLSPLLERGLTRLAFFGASETCEVALSAISGTNLCVVGILDNDPRKHGQSFRGHLVSPPSALDSLDCHVIVVTSFGHREEIIQQLSPIAASRGVEVLGL